MPKMEEVNNSPSPGGSVDGDEEKDGNKKIFMLDDELEWVRQSNATRRPKAPFYAYLLDLNIFDRKNVFV